MSWPEHRKGTLQTWQTTFFKRWVIEQKHYLTRASVWVWSSLQDLCAGLVSNFQMRDWEDQMLTLGCHYPTMVLDSGTGLFFFFVHMCEISDDVLCILDDQNCSTCPYMKMSSSVCRRVLRYGRVRASQVRWAVGSSAEVLENKAKWSRRPQVQGLQPDLCINTGSFVHTCQRRKCFYSKPCLLYRVCKLFYCWTQN